MKNALGIEVTRPNDVLVIMRGIPGSGKSTAAKRLVKEGVIHSTDDLIEATGDYLGYFEEIKRTNNWAKHGRMHSKNFKNAYESMKEGVSPVIIDNTNIKAAEAKKYVMAALELGYANENIEFVEVGTAGLTAEALAERNTHGVPLETIERMIKSMESVGPLTVERVVGAKDMYKNKPKVLYSAVVLDEASRIKLIGALGHKIPSDWDTIAHHMTIVFGKGLPKDMKDDEGKMVHLMATEIGISDMAIAVKVSGYPSNNDIPHVTLGVNTPAGGKAVMSNDIKNWERLNSHINLSGIVTEIKAK